MADDIELWEKDFCFLMNHKKVLSFSTTDENPLETEVYVSSKEEIEDIPAELFGLPTKIYLITPKKSINYREVEAPPPLLLEPQVSLKAKPKKQTYFSWFKKIFSSV